MYLCIYVYMYTCIYEYVYMYIYTYIPCAFIHIKSVYIMRICKNNKKYIDRIQIVIYKDI